MNGLASNTPSPSAVRLALGGNLLLVVQSLLLLLVPGLGTDVRALIFILTPIAVAALVAALIGLPDPPTDYWRRRHER